jgi:hypothetical protein
LGGLEREREIVRDAACAWDTGGSSITRKSHPIIVHAIMSNARRYFGHKAGTMVKW